MANTYTQLYIHVVFAVKNRQSLIHKEWKDELYKYICGTATGVKQKIYAINGVANHVHILLSISPSVALSDIIRDLKSNSSKWINGKSFVRGKFEWQEGFGAFSVSQSQLDVVIHYINNQEEHHRLKTFREEYHSLLVSYNIGFEEHYLFEWIDEDVATP